jgi:hypothetical protein
LPLLARFRADAFRKTPQNAAEGSTELPIMTVPNKNRNSFTRFFAVVSLQQRYSVHVSVDPEHLTGCALNLLMFAQLLLAELDVGRHWSATVPFPLQILGLIGFAIGMGLTLEDAIRSKRFPVAITAFSAAC